MTRVIAALLAFVFVVIGSITPAWSAEGMWTLDNPPLKAMQADIGWAPDHAWLDKVMKGSARMGFGCSSSFVSKDGLVLTNHHCVAGCVAQLSTSTSNLIKTGFLAAKETEERKCPATEVNRLEQMTDVTGDVTKATQGLAGAAFKTAQNAVKAKLTSTCSAGDDHYRCDVVDLYHGGQYKLYRYRRFKDVRLVFAPERSIAFFGGDPDNFNFPRYDLDMAIVRVYEDDGKPAKITDYFPINAKGPADGEAVFVTGHPGSTQRELTVAQLIELRDQVLVDNLLRTAEYRGVLLQYRTQGAEQMRIGSDDLFGVENRYKVQHGQLETLLDDKVFDRKKAQEAELRGYVANHPEVGFASDAWDDIATAVKAQHQLYQERAQLEEGRAFNTTYFTMARTLVRGAAERTKPNAERLPEFNDNRMPQVVSRLMSEAPIYPDLEKLKLTFGLVKFRELMGSDAPIVKRTLGKQATDKMAADLIDHTKLGDIAYRKQLWDGGATAIAASDDPFIKLAIAIDPDARAVRARYERDVESVIQTNTEKIAKARFAMAGDSIYPDATGTLRLSYGVVKGWDEAGKPVPSFTYIGGTFDRATGSDPFALPDSWVTKKDKLDAKKPFNIASTNDIIGGNSGSPLLNKKGELVGLIFDGNIHSLGGAYWYDGTVNRSVAVDSAAILEALDKVYNAKGLAKELSAH
jgi:hypothetical protein